MMSRVRKSVGATLDTVTPGAVMGSRTSGVEATELVVTTRTPAATESVGDAA